MGLTFVLALCGCGVFLPSRGGGEVEELEARQVAALNVAMAPGYTIEAVAQGLSFPTGVTFDDANRIYVVEAGYSYGEVFLTPKRVRVEPNGQRVTIGP